MLRSECGSVQNHDRVSLHKAVRLRDPETGDKIALSVSDFYTKLSVNDREYYFVRENGTFDGAATEKHKGPILVYAAD